MDFLILEFILFSSSSQYRILKKRQLFGYRFLSFFGWLFYFALENVGSSKE